MRKRSETPAREIRSVKKVVVYQYMRDEDGKLRKKQLIHSVACMPTRCCVACGFSDLHCGC